MDFLKRNFLFVVVFITGAAVLIIEVAAIRILAPYFGNTLFTISSIIGVVLGALSVGYYVGGIFADRYPRFSLFFLLIFIGGILSLFIQIFSRVILPAVGYSLDMKFGPPIMSLILFFPPSFVLGMISPMAIRLKALETEGIGRVSGSIFFWSTLGSIAGSFLAGFFLIPHLGISKVILYTSSVLLALGFLGMCFFRERAPRGGANLLGLLLIGGTAFSFVGGDISQPAQGLFGSVVFQQEGLYSQITIEETETEKGTVRSLRFDRSRQGGVFLESDELPIEYTKYYVLYRIINPDAKSALFLGGGAYATPRRLLLDANDIEKVDVVEIEPVLYSLAQRYFRLQEDPRLLNRVTDGRRFLQESLQNYDVIFGDVYYSVYSIPAHFTTQEFFQLAKSRLAEDGSFIMNVIGKLRGGGSQFLFSEIRTFRSVFPNSYLFAVQSPDNKEELQNFILLGLKDDKRAIDFEDSSILEDKNEIVRNLPKKLIPMEELDFHSAPIFTDDFSPVDYLTAQFF